eukprot:TRINITY_DN346_c3_g2_i1.p1 TRINITY_DN346_c3_g2~~TRINITY_DN346_c3_g2_i1.p1  ORF type:complete len:1091 (+),score=236.31 TRINITY_DN346_c3_g2_i1:398-3274(+)
MDSDLPAGSPRSSSDSNFKSQFRLMPEVDLSRKRDSRFSHSTDSLRQSYSQSHNNFDSRDFSQSTLNEQPQKEETEKKAEKGLEKIDKGERDSLSMGNDNYDYDIVDNNSKKFSGRRPHTPRSIYEDEINNNYPSYDLKSTLSPKSSRSKFNRDVAKITPTLSKTKDVCYHDGDINNDKHGIRKDDIDTQRSPLSRHSPEEKSLDVPDRYDSCDDADRKDGEREREREREKRERSKGKDGRPNSKFFDYARDRELKEREREREKERERKREKEKEKEREKEKLDRNRARDHYYESYRDFREYRDLRDVDDKKKQETRSPISAQDHSLRNSHHQMNFRNSIELDMNPYRDMRMTDPFGYSSDRHFRANVPDHSPRLQRNTSNSNLNNYQPHRDNRRNYNHNNNRPNLNGSKDGKFFDDTSSFGNNMNSMNNMNKNKSNSFFQQNQSSRNYNQYPPRDSGVDNEDPYFAHGHSKPMNTNIQMYNSQWTDPMYANNLYHNNRMFQYFDYGYHNSNESQINSTYNSTVVNGHIGMNDTAMGVNNINNNNNIHLNSMESTQDPMDMDLDTNSDPICIVENNYSAEIKDEGETTSESTSATVSSFSVMKVEKIDHEVTIGSYVDITSSKDELLLEMDRLDQEIATTEKSIEDMQVKCPIEEEDLDVLLANKIYDDNQEQVSQIYAKYAEVLTVAGLDQVVIVTDVTTHPFYEENKKSHLAKLANISRLFRLRVQKKKDRELALAMEYRQLDQNWKKSLLKQQQKKQKNQKAEAEKNARVPLRNQNRVAKGRCKASLLAAMRNDDFTSSRWPDEEGYRFKYARTLAVIPPMVLGDDLQKPIKYINKNGQIDDVVRYDQEKKNQNPWTEDEKNIFLIKYLEAPKQFGFIKSFLPNKSLKEVIDYYYVNKRQLQLKKFVKDNNARRRAPIRKNLSESPVTNRLTRCTVRWVTSLENPSSQPKIYLRI